MQSSLAPADLSQAGGGVMDVVTKSGGREFHGNAFEYFRNEATDARNFFDDPALERPIFRQNQFGGSLGGPLPLSTTFFFATYEGHAASPAASRRHGSRCGRLRGGDFNGANTVFDPLTLRPGARSFLRQPHSCGRRIDPIARTYLDQFEPLPNRTGDSRATISMPRPAPATTTRYPAGWTTSSPARRPVIRPLHDQRRARRNRRQFSPAPVAGKCAPSRRRWSTRWRGLSWMQRTRAVFHALEAVRCA